MLFILLDLQKYKRCQLEIFAQQKICSLPVNLKHITSALDIINKNDTRTLGMNVREKMQMPTENYVL